MGREIDIRKGVAEEEISSIRVATSSESNHPIVDTVVNEGGKVFLQDSDDVSGDVLDILSREHAINIIKGLDKAIDLGWFK